jgi:atypical dual specificity phosphatase
MHSDDSAELPLVPDSTLPAGAPVGFSWIERPFVAAMPRPRNLDVLRWLKRQGVEIILSLTEQPLDPDVVAQAGLLAYHVPVPDMEAPTQEDLDRCISAMRKARDSGMGLVVHCGAGVGRTGSVLACWFIALGETAEAAIRRIRTLRPGSIETASQEQAVQAFAEWWPTR